MRRQNTVAQYIATRPIMDLCERSYWRPRAWVSWKLWNRYVLDLEGEKKRAAVELEGEATQRDEEILAEEEKTVWERGREF